MTSENSRRFFASLWGRSLVIETAEMQGHAVAAIDTSSSEI